jgi:hypothetical protein
MDSSARQMASFASGALAETARDGTRRIISRQAR